MAGHGPSFDGFPTPRRTKDLVWGLPALQPAELEDVDRDSLYEADVFDFTYETTCCRLDSILSGASTGPIGV